jgi:hypothetical protein
MKYVLVTYKKKVEELPEIKVFENVDFYRAKRDFLHYQNLNIKVEIWESDGETARKLNI